MNGTVADALHGAQQTEAVEARHLVIRKHQVDRVRLEVRQRLDAVRRASRTAKPEASSASPRRVRVAA